MTDTVATTYYPHTGAFIASADTKVPIKAWEHLTARDTHLAVDAADGLTLSTPEMIQANDELRLKSTVPGHLTAAAGDGGSEYLTHLQEIQLLRDITGKGTEFFFAEQAFTKYDVPNLELRVPYMDIENNVQRLARGEKMKYTDLKTSEAKFDLTKLAGGAWTPIEDTYRAQIGPSGLKNENVRYSFKQSRNAEAIAEIAKFNNGEDNSASITSLGNIAAISNSGAGYHSDVNAPNLINDACNTFLTTNLVGVSQIIASVDFYSAYTSNTWTQPGGPNGLAPQRSPMGGVYQFPGLANMSAVIDVNIPKGSIYLTAAMGALGVGEGPKTVRSYYDEDQNAQVTKMLDFVEFKNLSEDNGNETGRKYGFKLNYTTS